MPALSPECSSVDALQRESEAFRLRSTADLIVLTPLDESHTELFRQLAEDASLSAYFPKSVSSDPDTVFNRLVVPQISDSNVFRAVVTIDGTVVGMANLKRKNETDAVIGIGLLPDARGTGAAYAVIDHIIYSMPQEWGVSRVEALIKPDNERSRRFFSKLGFTQENDVIDQGETWLVFAYDLTLVRKNEIPV